MAQKALSLEDLVKYKQSTITQKGSRDARETIYKTLSLSHIRVLEKYCRELGVKAGGKKVEIAERISDFIFSSKFSEVERRFSLSNQENVNPNSRNMIQQKQPPQTSIVQKPREDSDVARLMAVPVGQSKSKQLSDKK